jgi:hypothetical protein
MLRGKKVITHSSMSAAALKQTALWNSKMARMNSAAGFVTTRASFGLTHLDIKWFTLTAWSKSQDGKTNEVLWRGRSAGEAILWGQSRLSGYNHRAYGYSYTNSNLIRWTEFLTMSILPVRVVRTAPLRLAIAYRHNRTNLTTVSKQCCITPHTHLP